MFQDTQMSEPTVRFPVQVGNYVPMVFSVIVSVYALATAILVVGGIFSHLPALAILGGTLLLMVACSLHIQALK